MLLRQSLTLSAALLLITACGKKSPQEDAELLGNSCNTAQLRICTDNGGGHACYAKWNCPESTSDVGEIPSQAKVYKARGTAYYPDNSALEGGFVDRIGKPLRTLQDHLDGKAEYVSVAMDTKAFPYGTKLRIPELEKRYNRLLEFRVVDTGGAFTGKGTSRIDICVKNQSATNDATINGPLTLVVE